MDLSESGSLSNIGTYAIEGDLGLGVFSWDSIAGGGLGNLGAFQSFVASALLSGGASSEFQSGASGVSSAYAVVHLGLLAARHSLVWGKGFKQKLKVSNPDFRSAFRMS